jgi:hypothetical protein
MDGFGNCVLGRMESKQPQTFFYKKPIYSLGEILYSSYLFMKYWASLYPEDKQQMINIGVEKLASKKWERGQTCITMMFSLK